MTKNQWDALLDKDWAKAWQRLAAAPELVPRPKTAQITLRLPRSVVLRIKSVAAVKGLPYHALARSWILEGLRKPTLAVREPSLKQPQTAQLNLKLDSKTLDAIKARGGRLRLPYHRLARQWIEMSLAREERNL